MHKAIPARIMPLSSFFIVPHQVRSLVLGFGLSVLVHVPAIIPNLAFAAVELAQNNAHHDNCNSIFSVDIKVL